MKKINIAEKFALINDHYNPRVVGELNGQLVKLVKFQGPFSWHQHEQEDEMFLVTKGSFTMKLREGDQEIGEGEFIIIPRGTEHCPVADKEVEVMLFEPASTLNTGNVENELTRRVLDHL